MARKDLRDCPLHAALIHFENHPIADRKLLVLFPLLLESSAQRRLVGLTRFRAHMPDSASPLEYDSFHSAQDLPSWRMASHHGSASALRALMSASSLAFTSFNRSAPTSLLASSSVSA